MSDESFTDVLAMRHFSINQFRERATTYFEHRPEAQSLVMGVSQYFADEAGDAVHEHFIAFPTREPTWPHHCDFGEPPSEDGSWCSSCDPRDGDREGSLPWPSLDSNSEAVTAWSALCTEWGGGEGDAALVDPIAIARRADDGGVDVEFVHQVVRPWLDDNRAAEARDEEFWEEDALPPKPEPTRAPWTTEERALFEAVLAAPRDDGPRKVLVDYWLERGDVRGEFGALSFETPATSKDRARREQLVQLHGRAWLGPLQPAVSLGGATFARGPFASRVVVSLRADGDHSQLDEVDDWALVEAVHYAADDRPFSRRMTGLVELSGATGEVLERLHASGARPPLHTLGLVEPIQPAQWGPALNGVKTLRLERFDSWGRHDAEPWTRLSQWNQLETFEIWFSMNGESADGWNDDRGSRALTAFRPLLGPNTTLRVGYQLGNGARGGVVAVLKGQELALESAGFAGPRAQKAAEASLSGAGAKALPPEQSAPTASKTGWRKLLARFGF